MNRNSFYFATTLAIGIAGSAQAGVLEGWNLIISFNGGSWSAANNPSTWEAFEVQDPETGKVFTRVVGQFSNANWGCDWTLDLDPDPFVAANVNMTNNTGAPANFVVTTVIPAIPTLPGPTVMNGSVSGSVIDFNGIGGATISTIANTPWYEALVDGSVARTMYDDPSSVSAALQSTQAISKMNFAGEAYGAVNATIGIRNSFTLTAGDAANLVSTFNIVPTPAGFGVLALAGLTAARRRRG